jgi:hypothetical protein
LNEDGHYKLRSSRDRFQTVILDLKPKPKKVTRKVNIPHELLPLSEWYPVKPVTLHSYITIERSMSTKTLYTNAYCMPFSCLACGHISARKDLKLAYILNMRKDVNLQSMDTLR